MARTRRNADVVTLDPPEEGLEPCGTCGHSRRNHEGLADACARSLCACARFDLAKQPAA